jgi:hypothetical protein
VTTTVPPRIPTAADVLAPVTAALRASGAGERSVLAPGLLVPGAPGWIPATRLLDGPDLRLLLEAARRRWRASPHAAAALVWKSYSYWVTLPAVLGWAAARRVPLVAPADVLLGPGGRRVLPAIGLRHSVTIAVSPAAPPALSGLAQVRRAGSETELLGLLRGALLDAHLRPVIEGIRREVRIASRTLLGSVASGIATGVLRAAHVLPGDPAEHIATLTGALGVADLVELLPGRGGQPVLRRKTCCLAFTLPQPKVCAGCCLRA